VTGANEAAIAYPYFSVGTVKIDAALHNASLAHAQATGTLAKQTGPAHLGTRANLDVKAAPHPSGGQSVHRKAQQGDHAASTSETNARHCSAFE
jgi:hypothetical protein